jgi:hypothetical protein
MKQIFTSLLCTILTINAFAFAGTWQQLDKAQLPADGIQQLHPAQYTALQLNDAYTKPLLFGLTENPAEAKQMELPLPDGSMKIFRVWSAPVMEPELAAKYPMIKTFSAVAMGNSGMVAKLDYTVFGFHAMIRDGAHTYFIMPYSKMNDGYYICFDKKDMPIGANEGMHCDVADAKESELGKAQMNLTGTGIPLLQVNGATKRVYRLALSCTGEYAKAVDGATPTKPGVLSAMTTTMNMVNLVYETELGIHMDLVGNNDQIIYLDQLTDPFTGNNSGPTLQTENQTVVTNVIGALNYDIGHAFSTGGGGIADLSSACSNSVKARGVTGQPNPTGNVYAIDFVAHEMGHQVGADHTFNASEAQCGSPNGVQNSAYEPGSGSTIMAYAGICGNNNLQQHGDDYFHAISLDQISNFVASLAGTCGTLSPSGNTPATVPSFSNQYYIPYLTPFELTAPQAFDIDHDQLTYCWEEWDLGDFGLGFNETKNNGPIFRSFKYTSSQTRVFPALDKLRNNVTYYMGEKFPEVARTLNFALTVRDVYNGWGCFNKPSDKIVLNVINTGSGFELTCPNTAADYWQIGSSVMVCWNVSNTTSSPISCSNVDIYLSLDDGVTWPYTLASNTANDGSETITVPAGSYTASARVKVKGTGNVFFDFSNYGFIINDWPANISIPCNDVVKIYPVPANDKLYVELNNGKQFYYTITDAVGRQMIQQEAIQKAEVDVSSFASGVYFLQIIDKQTNKRSVKTIAIE